MVKIVIVPKKLLVANFLKEIVRWPSRWRTFWYIELLIPAGVTRT